MVIKQKLPQNCYVSFVSVVKELDNSKNKTKAPKEQKKMNLKYLLFLTSLNQQWPSNVPFPFSILKGQRFLLKKDY